MAEQQTQQTQQPQFNPTEARTYLQTFGHDVTAIDDTKLPEVYGKVKTGADTYINTQLEAKIKERGPFAENWRESIAGEDAAALETLKRFQTPAAVYKSYDELRKKMSSGELKAVTPYPDKGTADEQAAWRKDQGVPNTAAEYKVEAPKGVVIGEADKPYIDDFLKHAHANNLPQSAVTSQIAFWGEQRMKRQEAQAQHETQVKRETEDALRAEWGAEFRPAMTRIEGVLDSNLPAGSPLRDEIMKTLGTNADFARFMGQLAFQLNPTGTLTGQGGEGGVKSHESELTRIDTFMKTNRAAYNKDAKMQADYRSHLEAYQRLSGKSWGAK